MKRFFATAGAVAIGGLVAAGVAPAVEQAVTPKQYNALVKRVTKMEKTVDALGVVTTQCLLHETAPVSVYGTASEGYVYSKPDGSLQVVTALDVTETGQTPHYYLLGSTRSARRCWLVIVLSHRLHIGSPRSAARLSLAAKVSQLARD